MYSVGVRRNSFVCVLGLVLTCLLLTACGGGSGSTTSNNGGTTTTAGTTITGTVQAPSGAIARLDSDKSMMLAALDLVIPSSEATVTGLAAVANATVELIRIDDSGNQVGNVLATATTDASGAYSLDLPSGVSPSADLVVQIKDSTSTPVLRAIVSGDTVDIDPISQFILDTLMSQPNVALANIDIGTVKTLVDQVAALNISLDASASLADAQAKLQADSGVTQTVNQQTASLSSAAIVGSWGNSGDPNKPGMLVFYADGHYLNYETNAQDCPNGSFEYGTYTYDGSNLTFTAANDNGYCGFVDDGQTSATYPVSLTDNNNHINVTDPALNQVAISLPRTGDGNPDSIVGAWDIRESADDASSLVFSADGYYIVYDSACTAGGVEYGTYTWDGSTLSGNVIRDDNGNCGLGAGGTGAFTPVPWSVSSNVSTVIAPENTYTWDRLETSN